ncbi:VanZ family protein [Flaviaesturariibacter amylovorans]|uniref:VanZ family protein n=1 Tax=Flaviaesturariibacter amylovorans TaxID=1084520 RepID=A0ABP8GAR7_9BACT
MSRSLRIGLTAAYFLLCCYLFTMPGTAFPKEDWLDRIFFDKWVHIGLFGLLALLLCWCGPYRSVRSLFLIAALLTAYGGAVEFVQDRWIPHRSFDLWDWVADVVGIGTGLWAWLWLLPRWTGRRRNIA